MEPTPKQAELAELTDAAVEGRLTPEQRERLERRVLSDPAARRWYVERLHLNACLHWSAAEPEGLAADNRPGSSRSGSSGPGSSLPGSRPGRPWPVRLRRTAMAVLAAAAVLAVSVGPAVWWGGEPTPATSAPVATLTEAKGCKWEAGTLPTAAGARLTAGRLRLAEGLARLVFERGAEVTLEGPADLELVSADRCVLHSGRLVARVPAPAVGFVVDTPTAVLRDLGTEFGVSVAEGRAADVQVFSGIVDAEHRGSGRTERMLTGRNLRFTDDAVAEFAPGAEPPPAAAEPAPAPPPAGKVLLITTAQGRGKDAYVQQGAGRGSDLLLVKNASGTSGPHNRKTYVGFDLSALAGRRVLEAAVSFAFAPSGLGFASEVPDATFAVYGLTDESADDWAEKDLRWGNAPANRNGGTALDPDRVVKLGTFTLAQGEQRGTRTVSGPALSEFLSRDTNGLATLIVVRETPGSGRSCLVHGIAAKGHPSLPPPTLTLTVERP